MTDINTLFFELIQVALGMRICLSHTPSADEWGELYSMAKKQSLVGVCFVGVKKLVNQRQEPHKMLYLTWLGMAAKIQQRNEVMNRRCVELQTKLRKDGFPNCILKGQGIGTLYTTCSAQVEDLSLLRQSGDIDVWIDANVNDIMDYVQKECPDEKVDICGKHIEFRLYKDVEIEAHFIPGFVCAPIYSSRMKKYYEGERSRQMQKVVKLADGSEIIVPDNKFQVVQILNHVFTHFVFEGAGLRQVMDYYYAVKQSLTDKEKKEIVLLFKKTGLYRFAKAMSFVVSIVFGFEIEFIPKDEYFGRKILKSILNEGNFGKYDSKRDDSKMKSSFYRYVYHTKRQFGFIRLCPLEILWHPIMRFNLYIWRLRHGYFKN